MTVDPGRVLVDVDHTVQVDFATVVVEVNVRDHCVVVVVVGVQL